MSRQANMEYIQNAKSSSALVFDWITLLGNMIGGVPYTYQELHELREAVAASRDWVKHMKDQEHKDNAIVLNMFVWILSEAITHANSAKFTGKGEFRFVPKEEDDD